MHEKVGNVTAAERSARFGQKSCTILLTGLSGAGKSTTAYALERDLFSTRSRRHRVGRGKHATGDQ